MLFGARNPSDKIKQENRISPRLPMHKGAGADPGFQVRGRALKKIAPSGGRREHFLGISCEKSQFYAKKSYFFSNFRGVGRAPGASLGPPLLYCRHV